MHSTSIWLHNVLDSQPTIDIETITKPLTGSDGTVYTECQLFIHKTPGYGSLTLLMTNAQAQQIIDTLTAHIREQNQQAVDRLLDEVNADPR
jgi:hypothetical protein